LKYYKQYLDNAESGKCFKIRFFFFWI